MGQAIRTARLRRRQSAAEVAARVGVSLPTFRKLEHGDPTVSLGAFATTAWVLGLLPAYRPRSVPRTTLMPQRWKQHGRPAGAAGRAR
nr:helix-turn-helix transcriptional regulator [Methylobacterium sp.]USU34714.1 helix-turn-helix domain-containing protein [Methylobacterium sp.]